VYLVSGLAGSEDGVPKLKVRFFDFFSVTVNNFFTSLPDSNLFSFIGSGSPFRMGILIVKKREKISILRARRPSVEPGGF